MDDATINAAGKKIQGIIEKNNLKMGFKIAFPQYRKLPPEVQLALSIMKKHGMKIVFILEPQTKPV